MTAALTDVDLIVASIKAARSVTCPKCNARPGEECQSTGGGNRQAVPTHRAREKQVAGWTPEQLTHAVDLVNAQGRRYAPPAGYYAETDSWAPPAPAAKRHTPRGVRLSEQQAEEIERAAANDGVLHVSTAHFHGDAAHRQTVNALEAKGILRFVAHVDHDYARRLVMTEFGWQVYRQHRTVIRRLDDEAAAEFEAKAREQEQAVTA